MIKRYEAHKGIKLTLSASKGRRQRFSVDGGIVKALRFVEIARFLCVFNKLYALFLLT